MGKKKAAEGNVLTLFPSIGSESGNKGRKVSITGEKGELLRQKSHFFPIFSGESWKTRWRETGKGEFLLQKWEKCEENKGKR